VSFEISTVPVPAVLSEAWVAVKSRVYR
jgi:hypothetical protein